MASAAADPIAAPALLPVAHRVAASRRETYDTWTLTVEPSGAAILPAFAPGQFAMVYAFGAGEAPISLSGVEGNGGLVFTVRSVGTVTQRICGLRHGDPIGLRGPYGTPWPLHVATGRDVVVVAGGIGLAPMRPVIRALLANRGRYGAITVLYGARSPDELLYGDEIDGWSARRDLQTEVIVDAAKSDWRGRVGLVTKLVPLIRADPANLIAMLCGPEAMMRVTAGALGDRGVPADSMWVSLERSMKCGVGHCGHCQLGPLFVCKDGPVVRHDVAAPLMAVREL